MSKNSEIKEKLLSLDPNGKWQRGSDLEILPGYFNAWDMTRAFNIPIEGDGPIAAVRKWVERHGEYNLQEFQPGKWAPTEKS